MIFSQDRKVLRKMYADAWSKRVNSRPMSTLESQIADVIERHPEYHETLSGNELDADFAPEDGNTNPFLHMGLHLGLREQIATNRPAGIAPIFETLASRLGDAHEAEHRMIECLAEILWEAQRDGRSPDENRYLEQLRLIVGRPAG